MLYILSSRLTMALPGLKQRQPGHLLGADPMTDLIIRMALVEARMVALRKRLSK